ncbi:MAG: YegS/Rv2252/BmrU family lipid kinase [Oscillospiraceae bacterium]|nr:YegS/Rv2252/BmrU family lipid kinase [Oscillospiraceae bacterium]
MNNMLFVMNPFAGQRKANRHLADILTIFNRAGFQVSVHMTAGPGDCARVVAERAGSVDLVVCCGGDGTFNEAVNGLLESKADVPIGYIPAGSTNDFAASLKLPADHLEAARAIVDGTPMAYDICRFGQRYFAYVASFGAFTRASYATSQSMKNILGHTAYLLEGISELGQIHKTHARFTLGDGTVIEDDFIFGAISNSTSLGGILTLDPKQVDMSDGLFELLLVRAPKDLSEIAECIRALRSQKYNCRMLTFLPASQATIEADAGLVWTLDGERAQGTDQIEAENLHHAIRLMQKVTP